MHNSGLECSTQPECPQRQTVSSVEDDKGSLAATLSELRWVLLAVTLLGVISNFLLFAKDRGFYTPDSPSYLVAAGNLANGHGFTDSQGYPEVTRTPGYPLLIVPFLWMGLGVKYLILLQHILEILIAFIAAMFAYQVSKRRGQALLAGVLLCIDLPSLNAANTVMTETLFTAILTIALWLLWRVAKKREQPWQFVVLAGFLSGASVLVRPITMYFFLPAGGYLLLLRKKLRPSEAIVFCLAFALLPLGWMVRNNLRTGFFSVSAISGLDMLVYRAAGTLAITDPGDFSANFEKREIQLLHQACENTNDPGAENCLPSTIQQKTIALNSGQFMTLGRKIVVEHPFAYAKLSMRGAAFMMLGGDADLIMQITGAGARFTRGLILTYTVPLLCLALAGLCGFWNGDRSFFLLSLLVLGYFIVISTGAEAYSRLRVPIMPVYAVLIANGLDVMVTHFSKKSIWEQPARNKRQ